MSVQWGDAAVAGKDNQWQAIGEWVYTTLEAGRPDPSPEITANTQTLIAGAPDFYTKLSRITEYIQKNIRYFIVERGIGGLQANHAADIFRNRYGDCKDKTTLLISMLQVAGIHCLLCARRRPPRRRRSRRSLPLRQPHDHRHRGPRRPPRPPPQAVVKANDGKRYLIFDPTNERTPVGNLPSYEQGSYGILAAGADSQVIPLPVLPPTANGNDRKAAPSPWPPMALSPAPVDASHSGPDGGDIALDPQVYR